MIIFFWQKILLSSIVLTKKKMPRLVYHLKENKKGFETWRDFVHEPGVLREPLDVSLVAGVDEDRGIRLGAAPKGVVYQVPLLERVVALGVEIEMVECLSEVALFV